MNSDPAYSSLSPNSNLSVSEIDVFRKRLMANLAELNLNKARIKVHDFNQLSNYHQYALNILNNMQSIRYVEMNNPYNHNMQSLRGQNQPTFETINPYASQVSAVYKRDGSVEVVSPEQYSQKYVAEWHEQFDANMINPPSYIQPSNNCWASNSKR